MLGVSRGGQAITACRNRFQETLDQIIELANLQVLRQQLLCDLTVLMLREIRSLCSRLSLNTTSLSV